MRVYAEYASSQVVLRDGYKSAMEQRAAGVVTASLGLSTVLLGLLTYVRNAQLKTSPLADGLTLVAVGLLAASVVLAILVLGPRHYLAVKPEDVRVAVTSGSDTDEVAHKNVAITQLNVLDVAMKENGRKARLLVAALACEAGAAVLVASAVVPTLLFRP